MEIASAKVELDLLIQNIPDVLEYARRLVGQEEPISEKDELYKFVMSLREMAIRGRRDLED